MQTTKIYSEEKSQINANCCYGDNCVIHTLVWIGADVDIGNNVKIQPFVFIPDGVIIEDDVFIGPGVIFTNDKYPPSGGKHWLKTFVLKGSVIGANATILPGISIGPNARIGAGSVVTKSVPANESWIGNPAKLLVR